MEDMLSINGENIQRVYGWYKKGKFIVNRKYQRKLVWTINEKEKFIDSIIHQYSVPLFLFATFTNDNLIQYEIIDGMQRLDAIFSFIQGEFMIKSEELKGYFDLETMALTKQLLDEGILKQNNPKLPREVCTSIANYQLPFSTTKFDDEHIEEIFRRINSNGRQLSHQDLRQAGAVGEFPDLVRKISCRIRRDYTLEDILELSNMRKLSISNYRLNYGIKIDETFWIRQGIITEKNMRESRDEELVAQILGYILLGKNISPSSSSLNSIYSTEDDSKKLVTDVNNAITHIGAENIENMFMKVIDEIDKVLSLAKKTYSRLLFNNSAKAKARSFQVIFLTFYKFFQEEKVISNYDSLIFQLDGLGNRELKDLGDSDWNAIKRENKIKAVSGMIQHCFTVCVDTSKVRNEWNEKLENLLMGSNIELQMHDFKIGLFRLKDNIEFSNSCLSKVVKTLTAMANTHPNKIGRVILGVADNEEDSKLFSTIYNTQPVKFNDFYITGIEEEAKKSSMTLDKYWGKIREYISKEPISETTKSYILRNMLQVNYKDKSLIILENRIIDNPCVYDGDYYERNGNSVVKIKNGSKQFEDLMKRIYARKVNL